MEYGDLNSRFKQLQNIVSTATDTAIRTSTASEELFSERYKSTLTTSYGTKNNNVSTKTESTLKVLSENGDSWVEGNTYVMSKYYTQYGRFPRSQGEYNSFNASWGTDEDIYSWIFGNVGTVFNKYEWANKRTKMWNSTLWQGYSTNRTPTPNFMSFYNGIGKYMESDTYVKVKFDDTYNIEQKTIPTLTQMGLQLDTTWNGNTYGGSLKTTDYLSSVVHFGKSASGLATTSYYLTPYSLGVTYVPVEVLKPTFLSHLEQLVRFNKVKHTVTSAGDLSDFASADGCLTTDVFDSGANAVHIDSAITNIINDGSIEYDLSSVQVKVDYFLVDFYNSANYLVVNKIEGSTSQYNSSGTRVVNGSNTLTSLPDRLKARDTSPDKDGRRIVAKVSVKMKVHIPYKSSILQWFRHLNDTDGSNHYDLRLWDETSEQVDFNSNGVWFYYTTYTAVSR